MAFSKEMYLKTSATAGEEGWKGHSMGCNLDAYEKLYQNRIQNPKLYERDVFSGKEAEPGEAN